MLHRLPPIANCEKKNPLKSIGRWVGPGMERKRATAKQKGKEGKGEKEGRRERRKERKKGQNRSGGKR